MVSKLPIIWKQTVDLSHAWFLNYRLYGQDATARDPCWGDLAAGTSMDTGRAGGDAGAGGERSERGKLKLRSTPGAVAASAAYNADEITAAY